MHFWTPICTKSCVRRCFAHTPLGKLTYPPRLLVVFRGSTSERRGGEGREGEERGGKKRGGGGEGKEKEKERRGGKGREGKGE